MLPVSLSTVLERRTWLWVMEFRSIVLEYSWTPFQDLWVDPALEASQNFSLITILSSAA